VKALRWLARQLYPLALVLWGNGVLLRLTVRDSAQLLAPLYYATPWPVLALLTLPFIYTFRRQPRMVFAVIIAAHLFLGAWLIESWRSDEPSTAPADLRIVQWNVARPAWRFEGIAERVRAFDADLVAISEPIERTGSGEERWREALRGYAAEFTPGNMLCAVRGEVLSRATGLLAPASYFSRFEVRIKGREFTLLQIDIDGVPAHSRREPLTKLAELVASMKGRPLVLLGDFNTPRDSVHIAPLRSLLVNAFETAGIGSGETWPVPLPVLSLDQIWCGGGLAPVRCRHGVTFRSDHRPVVAELRFE